MSERTAVLDGTPTSLPRGDGSTSSERYIWDGDPNEDLEDHSDPQQSEPFDTPYDPFRSVVRPAPGRVAPRAHVDLAQQAPVFEQDDPNEALANQETVVTAHEVLGRSKLLRIAIRKGADRVLDAFTFGKALSKVGRDMPKLLTLDLRKSAAERKVARKNAKRGTSFFKSRNKRFEAAARRAETDLKQRTREYDRQEKKKDRHLVAAEEKLDERTENAAEMRKALIEQKIVAQEQKLLRKARKNSGVAADLFGGDPSDWSRRSERRKAAGDLSETEKRVVRAVAIDILKKKKQNNEDEGDEQ